jgi:hypothetical protein
MDTKICFKCGKELPIGEFYKHTKMADGLLGKCKECTKSDVRRKYEENLGNPEYIEKERDRGRKKYHRLYSGENYKKPKHKFNKSAKSFLHRRGIETGENEVHHWNYSLANDVFILSRRAHKLVHKYITYDSNTNCFLFNGTVLMTKKQHYEYMIKVFLENNVNYTIDAFPDDFDNQAGRQGRTGHTSGHTDTPTCADRWRS